MYSIKKKNTLGALKCDATLLGDYLGFGLFGIFLRITIMPM